MYLALCFSYFWFFQTYDKIIELNPTLPPARAELLASLIDDVSERTGIDAEILVALSFQESRFKEKALSCPQPGSCDHGLVQVNSLWVKHWKLNKKKLIKDDEYNLEVATRILVDLKDRFGKEHQWWGRYHSSTPKFRAVYQKEVKKWLGDVHGDNLLVWRTFPHAFILSDAQRCLRR